MVGEGTELQVILVALEGLLDCIASKRGGRFIEDNALRAGGCRNEGRGGCSRNRTILLFRHLLGIQEIGRFRHEGMRL